MQRTDLIDYTAQLLQTAGFKDYCPNGLQVEGASEVKHIVTGVTASMDLLQKAVECGADTVMVHHGYFWKSESPTITGLKYQRIRFLIEHQLNLIAYHLPLDAHPTLGNNAQLATRLAWQIDGVTGEQGLMAYGAQAQESLLHEVAQSVKDKLARAPMVIGDENKPIKRIAWCTGAAQHYMMEAIALGVDLFVSGEISEQTVHLARESGVAYMAAGHHATERYGIQALGQHLADKFQLKHTYCDMDNPV